MSYTVTTQYDSRMPSWPGNGTPFTLIACHDTEGGQGRVGALGTIQFLIDTPERGASYHEIWWYHESTDEFGVIRIVPPYRAAGSVAPQTNLYFPTAWVKESLGAQWWDPNQGIYAVSIAGRVADVNRYSQNPKFLDHAHRRMLELWKELGVTRRAEHFQFNSTTRSDWGKLLMPALGGQVTSDRFDPTPEANMNLILKRQLEYWTVPANWAVYESPLPGAAVVERLAAGIAVTIGETADGIWRLVLLGTDASREGWVIRKGMTPVTPGGDPALQERFVTAVYTDTPFGTVDSGKVTELEGTISTQAEKIASLQTELGAARLAMEDAQREAEAAKAAAAPAMALRAALTDFLN